jgi:hypothetical protein
LRLSSPDGALPSTSVSVTGLVHFIKTFNLKHDVLPFSLHLAYTTTTITTTLRWVRCAMDAPHAVEVLWRGYVPGHIVAELSMFACLKIKV